MLLDDLALPIVLAPLAGGPSTPELAAAVSEAGGLGQLAAGYLSAEELARQVVLTRELTDRAFGVNLFVPGPRHDPALPTSYGAALRAAHPGVALGAPRWDDDAWEAKLDLVTALSVPLVSFTFGGPSPDVLSRVRDSGAETWVTVTTPQEATTAAAAGATGLVVQGYEAGGHRSSFDDADGGVGLLALLQLVSAAVDLPLVAAGGITTGAAVAAVLVLGARAAAVGTAFLRSPEAGTSALHREALTRARPTALTRAFTGRLARGLVNDLVAEQPDAPSAYPEVHHLTAPLRAAARAAGDPELVNLWAGQAYPLAVEAPAAEVVRRLVEEARAASRRARRL